MIFLWDPCYCLEIYVPTYVPIFLLVSMTLSWDLLALRHVLRKKENIKEEERQSMKSEEGTQTEEGLKWLKKQKKRSEVKEKRVVKG
jgi:hypothetical protein